MTQTAEDDSIGGSVSALPEGFQLLNGPRAVLLALIGIVCFHAAYTPANSGPLAIAIVGYLICLVQLARLRTTRQCFYAGMAVGLACVAPQLECFWRIFGPEAIALWLVLAFWTGLFLALSHLALRKCGPTYGAVLIPFLWTGLEYFRSELYYLRFSWLNVGYVCPEVYLPGMHLFGMYGVGFLAVLCVMLLSIRPTSPTANFSWPQTGGIMLIVLAGLQGLLLTMTPFHVPRPNVVMAGVQLEFPTPDEIIRSLDKVITAQTNIQLGRSQIVTNVDLIVLPEYALEGEPPGDLKDWCRKHAKFVIVGGKDPLPRGNYFNTAFVISTNGEVVFKQVKSVPIQFFQDGLPAPDQKVWDSPWGRIGICICYDLSYTRVTDELVRQGAQLLIVPTMDVADWGRHQHELHARVAPVRAAEYGLPIFRVASSGISQGVNHLGRMQTRAPFEGEGEILFFGANLNRHGSLPVDRRLAPLCVMVTGAFVIWLAAASLKSKLEKSARLPRS